MLGLDGPPSWKMQKIPTDEFTETMGGIQGSVRLVSSTLALYGGLMSSVVFSYDYLWITGPHVNVRWDPVTGQFKISGTYGKK
jgi:hypothetical protein